MIPVPAVEEMYNSIVNGATSLTETRMADAPESYHRAFEALRMIADLDPGPAPADEVPMRGWGWVEFEPSLSTVLDGLEEDEYLILSVKSESTFIQFSGQGAHGMRAEVSSNSVLPSQHQLSRPQLERLTELGWRPPTGSLDSSTPHADPDGSPNFFLDLPAPIDPDALASLVVTTLIEVLQVPYPNDLTYEAFGHDAPLRLPSLKLTDEARPTSDEPKGETAASVAAKLRSVIEALVGHDEPVESDGEYVIRIGSASVRVLAFDDIPAVRAFAPLLLDVSPSDELVAELNRLNSELRFIRIFLAGTSVIAASELLVDPFEWSKVHVSILGLLNFADSMDHQLQEKFGGTLASGEAADRAPDRPRAGYL